MTKKVIGFDHLEALLQREGFLCTVVGNDTNSRTRLMRTAHDLGLKDGVVIFRDGKALVYQKPPKTYKE